MFTIEVKKRGKDEEFSFEDLEMFHKECGGGRIMQELEDAVCCPSDWTLICQRCGASIEIKAKPNFQTAKVIATAVDGEERKITRNIAVIQKI